MTKVSHKTLAAALAAFQEDLPDVHKGSINPHFKSKYADLTDVSKVVLPALARQGLSWVAAPTLTEGMFVLAYALMHESGEKIEGMYPLPAATTAAQQLGSAITYARRYALSAVTGVAADEDDDGNAGSQAKAAVQPPRDWRTMIADAAKQDDLTAIFQAATSAGWATPDVVKALTARKKALVDG